MGLFDNNVDDELSMESGGVFAFEDEDISEEVPAEGGEGDDAGDEVAGDEMPEDGGADEDVVDESDFIFEDDELSDGNEATVGGDSLEEQMNPARDTVDAPGAATVDAPASTSQDAPDPTPFDPEPSVTADADN